MEDPQFNPNLDPDLDLPEVDILREPVTVDLLIPITVDGKEYREFTFDFGRISPDDLDKFKTTFKRLHPDVFNPAPIDEPDYQELFLMKAGQLPVAVLRALQTVDKAGVYGLALEWLGKASVKKKRRKR